MDTQHAFYNEDTGTHGPGHRALGSPVEVSRDAGRTTGQGQGSGSKASAGHAVDKIPPSKEAPGAAAGMDFVPIDVETANRRRSSYGLAPMAEMLAELAVLDWRKRTDYLSGLVVPEIQNLVPGIEGESRG